MKRFIFCLLMVCLIAGLVACGGRETIPETTDTASTGTSETSDGSTVTSIPSSGPFEGLATGTMPNVTVPDISIPDYTIPENPIPEDPRQEETEIS